MTYFKFAVIVALMVSLPQITFAKAPKKNVDESKKASFIKGKDWQFVPVPVWESRPDEGNSYGLMPILLMTDKDSEEIKAIFGSIIQYNTVTNVSTALLAYFYPEPEQEILFYGEIAQDYSREFSGRFFDPHIGKFYVEADAIFLKTPFGRFYGLGPRRVESNQSNYTARSFNLDLKGGYYLKDTIHANYAFRTHTTDILTRAMPEFDDTLTTYGGLPEVVDSTNFIHEVSLTFDNRPEREYSRKGTLAEARYFLSHRDLGSDKTFQGFQFELVQLIPWSKPQMTTAFRLDVQQVYGSAIPFYEQSSLGGDKEMRNFVTNRYVDKGKMVFQVEQRIKAKTMRVMGTSFDINIDPFFELGRVFNNLDELGFNYWQPAVGVGFRLFVPPNVVGRLDMAIGVDGFEIYTALGYPF